MEKRYDLHTGICKTCKKEYTGQGKFFCSRSCLNKGRVRSPETREKLRLANLGKKLSKEAIEKRSRAVRGSKRSKETKLKMSGSNHYNWKGGITPINVKIRNSIESRLWRTSVFERDGYQCIWGGREHGNKLNADHIKPFALFPELRFAIDNGRTLCESCHKKTDTYGNKKQNWRNL